MSIHMEATKNYNLFDPLAYNRDLDENHVIELVQSMKEGGFWPDKAIGVRRNLESGKLDVLLGHHRFEAARRLGIAVVYVVIEDDRTIWEDERLAKKWSWRDYLESYSRRGFSEYLALREYHRRTGIPLALCIAFMGGHTAGFNLRKQFLSGAFVCNGGRLSETMADLVATCKAVNPEVATNTWFCGALARIASVPEFDPDRFKKKVTQHSHMLKKAAGQEGYSQLIENIYNHCAKNNVPLSFRADEEARKRNAVSARKSR